MVDINGHKGFLGDSERYSIAVFDKEKQELTILKSIKVDTDEVERIKDCSVNWLYKEKYTTGGRLWLTE